MVKASTIIAYSLCVLLLTLPVSSRELFQESADKDTRYEVRIVAEKHQRLRDGLKFTVEIENKTSESIQVRVQSRNPPFSFMVFGDGFMGMTKSMDAEIRFYTNPRTITIDGNSKIQLDPVVVREYSENGRRRRIRRGEITIIGSLDFIDTFEGKRRITTHRIGPTTIYMER